MSVAVVGFAQSIGSVDLVPVFQRALANAGLERREVDFWCSGSSDYVVGRAFSFVSAVDAIGASPPICESHVEMDAAWALYEAYVKILAGEAETALVYGFGAASAGDIRRILALQLDPYTVAPLWPDAVSIAALQARAAIDAGVLSDVDLSDESDWVAPPIRVNHCAPVPDGAAAVVLAATERARQLRERPAWITGFAHRIDPQGLGERDLTTVPSATAAAAEADVAGVEVAELHAPYLHQGLLLRRAMGLGAKTRVTRRPAPMFAAGLARIGTAAEEILTGRSTVTLGHATSGPALQQNLVCVMRAEP
ncbi:lipid-transfer protein [Actinoplanes sp. NPDC051851]|uniref:lipid-transfer protein n=1 Tax=Actinoplanes sp. NPDC051851 TaxID=3154753 RepID=UPI0034186F63